MKKILDKRNMTAEDWQNYRRNQKQIGGSDCAIIMGLNKYKTAFTLWLEKTGQIEPPDINNEYIEWGNILEPVIRDKFKRVTGFKVYQNNFVLQHPEHDFMVANIDGEVIDDTGERCLLEIKTANERMKEDWKDGPPHHYMLQVQHYLAVCGFKTGYIAVLIGGNHFKYFKIERDDYVIDKIIAAEKEFMRMVDEMIPPEITGLSPDTDWLAQAYPTANDEEGILNENLEAFAERYIELQTEIKGLQEECDYIKNRIKLEAKEYRTLKGGLFKVSMPTVKKVSFDSKTFAAEHPDLYNQYKTKETTYRTFSISEIQY